MKTKSFKVHIFEVDDKVNTPFGIGTIKEVPELNNITDYIKNKYTIDIERIIDRNTSFVDTRYWSSEYLSPVVKTNSL